MVQRMGWFYRTYQVSPTARIEHTKGWHRTGGNRATDKSCLACNTFPISIFHIFNFWFIHSIATKMVLGITLMMLLSACNRLTFFLEPTLHMTVCTKLIPSSPCCPRALLPFSLHSWKTTEILQGPDHDGQHWEEQPRHSHGDRGVTHEP